METRGLKTTSLLRSPPPREEMAGKSQGLAQADANSVGQPGLWAEALILVQCSSHDIVQLGVSKVAIGTWPCVRVVLGRAVSAAGARRRFQ